MAWFCSTIASCPPELCHQKPELRWREDLLSFMSNLAMWALKQPSLDRMKLAPSSFGPNPSPGCSTSAHQAEQHNRGHLMPPLCCPHFFYLSIYFWLHCVFIFACRLSLVVASGGLLFFAVCGLLIVVAPLVAEQGL